MKRWERWTCGAVLACASVTAHGGAYMRSEAELLQEYRFDYAWGNREVDGSGSTRTTDCEQTHSAATASFDYGFSYYLSGFAKGGVAQTRCGDASEAGPADLSFGVRGRLDVFANNRSWELEAYVPASAIGGQPELGCDAYGGTLRLEARDEIVPLGFLGYGAAYRYWGKPLAPQALALVSYAAPMDRRAAHPRWDWGASLHGTWALGEGDEVHQGPGVMLDCGSRVRIVRAALDISYKVGLDSRLGCGISLPVWGRDTRLTQGLACVYSVIWE